jgi:hypothetical protein
VSGYVGKTVTVYGKIEDGRFLLSAANQPTLLNMGGKFPNQKLTVVVYGINRPNFGYKPEEVLINKVVYVTGKVELYKSKPQIIVENPFEIAFSAPGGKTPQSILANKKQAKEDDGAEKLSKKERRAQEKEQAAIEKANREANKEARERAGRAEPKTPVKEAPVTRQAVPAVVQKPVVQKPVVQTKITQPGQAELLINSNISLRGGPGTNFGTIGSLKKGTRVKVVSSSYGWTKIMEKTGGDESRALAGYVRSEKLQ